MRSSCKFLLPVVCLVLPLAGCGSREIARATGSESVGVALERYIAHVEPIRLYVNRLLEGADPILGAFREHRVPAERAASRMGALERRFAASTVDVAAIEPAIPELRSLQAGYAGTFVLEDAYLSALVSGLARDDLHELPDTQAAQRAAIIRWRTGLMVLARRAHASLPADLQHAGRGEIAPSPRSS